jgi:hypothetical protein
MLRYLALYSSKQLEEPDNGVRSLRTVRPTAAA